MWVDEPTPAVINQAQTTVLSELHQRFQDHEITIPYPQRTLNSRSGGNQSDQKLAHPESTQI
jgi:small-conductance mechanosensitive channel